MIGLGKLGLPCLLAMEKYGHHQIFGFDPVSKVRDSIISRNVDYWEEGVNDLLKTSEIVLTEKIEDLVSICDVIFIAVQTPHTAEFEGKTPMPASRRDFDYKFLESAVTDVANGLLRHKNNNPLIVTISTVLPGTMATRVLPKLESARADYRFAYNPYFIAMGTTISDFLNPEFILVGGRTVEEQRDLVDFYSFLPAEVMPMDIESAELTKVAYNTFIGFKIVFANALAEITDARGGDVDKITNALSKATKRIMSGTYMTAGMGDGGGCHPRDQIAMSWLAKESDLSVDIFEFLADARDKQTLRQAQLIDSYTKSSNLKPVLLGVSYKPDSPLDIGSPARLLEYYLRQMGHKLKIVDPWIYPENNTFLEPSVFFVSSRHKEFRNLEKYENSIIIDPWGFVETVAASSRLIKPGRPQ